MRWGTTAQDPTLQATLNWITVNEVNYSIPRELIMATRPSVFIGSSAEGLPIAKAIQLNLDRACEVVIWSQGVFGLNGGTLEELVNQLNVFDFAVLVLTPDDLTTSRGDEQASPRDNVVFEAGMFLGSLGRQRTFLVYNRAAKLKLPSDLAGITLADYQPHESGNHQAAVGAACTRIEAAISSQGVRQDGRIKADITTNTQFQIISDLLDKSMHQFIILMHEESISIKRESPFSDGLVYYYNMPNRSLGSGAFSVSRMCELLPDAGLLQPDLRQNVSLTARGHEFAKWLLEHGCKALYFTSPLGSWGERPADLTKDHPWSPEAIQRQRELIRQGSLPIPTPQAEPPPKESLTTGKKPRKKKSS